MRRICLLTEYQKFLDVSKPAGPRELAVGHDVCMTRAAGIKAYRNIFFVYCGSIKVIFNSLFADNTFYTK